MAMRVLENIYTGVLDWVYPRRCAVCGAACRDIGRYLCWDCLGKIDYNALDTVCNVCGKAIEGKVTVAFVCSACKEKSPHYDMARSAAHYRGTLRKVILDYKYHRQQWLAWDLANLLESSLRSCPEMQSFDAIVPIPLHPRKERQRTFNQAMLLGEEIAKRLECSFFPNALVRTRYTTTQTRMSATERKGNVECLFKAHPQISNALRNRRILLVDDVMTTGATLDAAALALKQVGVRKVLCATLARE